jgi:hypothetical protein
MEGRMGGDVGHLDEAAGSETVQSPASVQPAHREFCGNCGTKFSGHFCFACGEERDTHRRSLAKFLHNLIEDVLSFDSRIIITAIALTLRPGELPCAFREGRLRRYVPPIRLYFSVTVLFFLTLSVSGIALMRLEIVDHPLTPAMRAQIVSHLIKREERINSSFPGARGIAGRAASPLTILQNSSDHSSIYIGNAKGRDMLPSLRAEFFVPEGKYAPKLSAETKKLLTTARLRLKAVHRKLEVQNSG